jgi:hypothetical protein
MAIIDLSCLKQNDILFLFHNLGILASRNRKSLSIVIAGFVV